MIYLVFRMLSEWRARGDEVWDGEGWGEIWCGKLSYALQ